MKNDRFIKTTLAVIALALLILAGNAFRNKSAAVQAASGTNQVWEYKSINRVFNWKDGKIQGVGSASEDGQALPPVAGGGGAEMRSKLTQLGRDGWELVAVTPYSMSGGVASTSESKDDRTRSSGAALNGVTTVDVWIFKRQKP
jgi:hypothetical protein